jgi:ribonuclease J
MNKLNVIPLGGIGEIGKNMTIVEFDRTMVVIDAGLMFPDDEMPGIDLVLPDFNYVKKKASRLKAIILTHGHEDHIGGLPFLLREVKVPVYGSKLTLGLAKVRTAEYINLSELEFVEIDNNSHINFSDVEFSFFRTCHSVPDGLGILISSPIGKIVYSSDFKFDQTPIDNKTTEMSKLVKFGEEGILALFSDSTNAELQGYTKSEKYVGKVLYDIIEKAKGRVIVASFASHIHRIQQIIDIAKSLNRKVVIIGMSMIKNVNIAVELEYLKVPSDIFITPEEVEYYPPDKVLVICTGSQGEPLSALAKIASRDHKRINIKEGDTVIISAKPVPGNEKSVSKTINQLYRAGATVHYEAISDVHVSGHASAEELKLMLNIIKPKFFIPIHGEHRHLIHHAALAVEVGIPKQNILITENGSVIEFKKDSAKVTNKINAGLTFVDGLRVGEVGDIVIRDRQRLSRHGIIIVVVTIDQNNGTLIAGPDIISRGFVYVRKSEDFLEEARMKVTDTLKICEKEKLTDWMLIKNHIRDTLSKYIYENTKRRPMIIPIVMEI